MIALECWPYRLAEGDITKQAGYSIKQLYAVVMIFLGFG
jgi:hypothetical protein